jgi:hypothetical protein
MSWVGVAGFESAASTSAWSKGDQRELPGGMPSRVSPPHPKGAQEEGDEEHANAGKQQVKQALHDNAQDTQRHRRDHQQEKEHNHPILRSAELPSGGPTAARHQRLARVGH